MGLLDNIKNKASNFIDYAYDNLDDYDYSLGINPLKPGTITVKASPKSSKSTTTAKSSTTKAVDTGYFKGTNQSNNINGTTLKKTGLTLGDTALKGSKTPYGKSMNTYNIWTDGKNYYVYVDSKGVDDEGVTRTGGYYLNLGAAHKGDNTVAHKSTITKNLENLKLNKGIDFNNWFKNSMYGDGAYTDINKYNDSSTTIVDLANLYKKKNNTNTNTNNNTGGSNKAPSSSITMESIRDMMDEFVQELKTPELATPEEMAKYYGVDYDYDKILAELNNYINQLYDDTAAEIATQRDIYNKKTAANALNTIENYVESYANANNNNIDRAARAANLLSSNINTMYNDAVNNRSFNNMLNEAEAARKMELAANPSQALEKYNALGTYLLEGGQKKLQSEVQKYAADMAYNGALMAGDLSVRNAMNTANANTYQSLLNSGASGYNPNNSYYNFYNSLYKNKNTAANTTTNLYASSAGVKGNSYVN